MSLKLVTETPLQEQFEYIVEEKNNKGASLNKNKRIYSLNEMTREVDRYVNEMVKTSRSMGELNHPASAEVNPERACHLVVEMRKEGNVFFGRSKVLSTPMGMIVRSLINDGVKVGMSSRALGKIIEEGNGVNRVTDMRLVAIDCVADPSFTKAFVNGILESKQFVCGANGTYEEIYDNFESGINTLPKKDVESFLKEQILQFFKSIKHK